MIPPEWSFPSPVPIPVDACEIDQLPRRLSLRCLVPTQLVRACRNVWIRRNIMYTYTRARARARARARLCVSMCVRVCVRIHRIHSSLALYDVNVLLPPSYSFSFFLYVRFVPTVSLSICWVFPSPSLYSYTFFYLYLYYLLSLSQRLTSSVTDTFIDCSFVRSLILSLPRLRCWRRLRVKWSGVIQNPVCSWRFRLHRRAIRTKISSEWTNVPVVTVIEHESR